MSGQSHRIGLEQDTVIHYLKVEDVLDRALSDNSYLPCRQRLNSLRILPRQGRTISFGRRLTHYPLMTGGAEEQITLLSKAARFPR